jgi:hypothetical protein
VEKERSMTSVAALMLLALAGPPNDGALRDVQRSHIEANVPPPADFARLLRRDLERHFRGAVSKAVRVEHELLRDAPTQSGVAYPKFYVWVRVMEDGRLVTQGAVRVAAVERKRFDVTSFLSEQTIRDDPAAIHAVFPALVCDKIKAKLGIEQ